MMEVLDWPSDFHGRLRDLRDDRRLQVLSNEGLLGLRNTHGCRADASQRQARSQTLPISWCDVEPDGYAGQWEVHRLAVREFDIRCAAAGGRGWYLNLGQQLIRRE